ncbi:MAG: PIN domain-containing protein [Chloroflexi bacterium]|nr:MAG: PIN domain-containing protein [Chloroflexota bacterium]
MKFVDTSFWYALADGRDSRHDLARRLRLAERGALLTSNYVVGETWTLLRRRAGHAVVVRFLDQIDRLSQLSVAHVDEETEAGAWRWLRAHDKREYSFVDATSFAIMRQRHIREALAFDGDFNAAGFVELRPPEG